MDFTSKSIRFCSTQPASINPGGLPDTNSPYTSADDTKKYSGVARRRYLGKSASKMVVEGCTRSSLERCYPRAYTGVCDPLHIHWAVVPGCLSGSNIDLARLATPFANVDSRHYPRHCTTDNSGCSVGGLLVSATYPCHATRSSFKHGCRDVRVRILLRLLVR